MVSKFHRNSVVRGDETRGENQIVPSAGGSSLNFPVISPLLKRATRVLYVCFSFPVEKSLIIGHGNAKWADQRDDISLSSVYNTLAHSTNPFILPPPVENYLFYEDGRHISLDKKKRRGKRKKKKRRKKPRGLIKWRQQYSPSVSPGIFYHWGHRNSHNQRLLSRVNSELPPLASIFFRHIPLTVYPTLLHFATVSSRRKFEEKFHAVVPQVPLRFLFPFVNFQTRFESVHETSFMPDRGKRFRSTRLHRYIYAAR